MGVRGLTSRVQKFSKKISDDFFHDSEIFIDGPSLGHSITDAQLEISKCPSLDKVIEDISSLLEDLERMNPRSIEVVFDGTLPEKKFTIRKERRQRQAFSNVGKDLFAVSTVLYLVLTDRHPNVEVSIVAEEADDAIATLIASKNTQNRKIIFSNDSDFYTFKFPGDVEVVSYPKFEPCYNGSGKFLIPRRSINVRKCAQVSSSMMPKRKLLIPMANFNKSQLDGGFIFLNSMHEFINIFHKTGRLASYLPVLHEEGNMGKSAWICGKIYRSYAYSLLIREYCEKNNCPLPSSTDKGETLCVTEYYQDCSYGARTLPIFLDTLDKSNSEYYDYEGQLKSTFEDSETIANLSVDEVGEVIGFKSSETESLEKALLEVLEEKGDSAIKISSSAIAHLQASLYSRLMVELVLYKVKKLSDSKIGFSMWKLQKGSKSELNNKLVEDLAKLSL